MNIYTINWNKKAKSLSVRVDMNNNTNAKPRIFTFAEVFAKLSDEKMQEIIIDYAIEESRK